MKEYLLIYPNNGAGMGSYISVLIRYYVFKNFLLKNHNRNINLIVMYNSHSTYFNKDGVNTFKNMFEYYFEPIEVFSEKNFIPGEDFNYYFNLKEKSFNYKTIHKKKYKIHLCNWPVPKIENIFMKDIIEIASIYHKKEFNIKLDFIKPKKYILDIVEKKLKDVSFCIGVHFRCTDATNAKRIKYSIDMRYEKYFTNINYIIENKKLTNYKILICTDSNVALNKFKERFNDKIIYFEDHYRRDFLYSKNMDTENFRDINENKHKLGLDAIIEMLTLSKVNILLHSKSLFNIFTYYNDNVEKIYVEDLN